MQRLAMAMVLAIESVSLFLMPIHYRTAAAVSLDADEKSLCYFEVDDTRLSYLFADDNL